MKKYIFSIFAVCLLVVFISCNKNSSQKKDFATNDDSEEVVNELKGSKKAANCSEFLDQYEKWVNEYLNLLDDYMKNPTDPTLAQKYSTVAQEASNWAVQWSKLYTCVGSKKYQQRYEEMAKRIEKKVEEMGLQ